MTVSKGRIFYAAEKSFTHNIISAILRVLSYNGVEGYGVVSVRAAPV